MEITELDDTKLLTQILHVVDNSLHEQNHAKNAIGIALTEIGRSKKYCRPLHSNGASS